MANRPLLEDKGVFAPSEGEDSELLELLLELQSTLFPLDASFTPLSTSQDVEMSFDPLIKLYIDPAGTSRRKHLS